LEYSPACGTASGVSTESLLADTLESLCTDDDPRLLIRFCEMRLLDDVGFRPELNECVFTHEPIAPEDQFFSNAEGGVVSPMAARLSLPRSALGSASAASIPAAWSSTTTGATSERRRRL